VDLIQRRATSDPDLIDWIAMELTTAPHAASADGTIDPQPIADRARNLLAGHGRRANYWAGYRADGDEAELRALVEKAVPFLEAGDGRNALRILEAVAEPLVEDWLDYGYEDDETSYLLFEDLGRMMAEAVLMGDLDPKARVALRDTLLAEYPLDEEERGAIGRGDVGLIYVLGANGQLLMHFAAFLGMPWPDYIQAMRDGVATHGPVRAGVYAMTTTVDEKVAGV
jgi:hypothetical protein